VSYPTNGPHRRDPLLFVSFDQRIDAAAVLKTIAVKAAVRAMRLKWLPLRILIGDETVNRLRRRPARVVGWPFESSSDCPTTPP
jgi:hypothetical protein